MKTLYVLIGPPAIGKTTWIKRFAPHAKVISRDDTIERIAHDNGLTYDEAYATPPQDAAENHLVDGMEKLGIVVPSDLKWRPYDFKLCRDIHRQTASELASASKGYANSDDDVVLDMTNMDKENRALYMPMFTQHRKVAVVFNFKGNKLVDALKRNAEKRSKELAKQGKHKTISGTVIDRMVASYQPPEATEGFDDIVSYDNSGHLLGLNERVRKAIRSMLKGDG